MIEIEITNHDQDQKKIYQINHSKPLILINLAHGCSQLIAVSAVVAAGIDAVVFDTV